MQEVAKIIECALSVVVWRNLDVNSALSTLATTEIEEMEKLSNALESAFQASPEDLLSHDNPDLIIEELLKSKLES